MRHESGFRDQWARQRAAASSGADGPLPAHHRQCFGCGPQARHGLHLQVRRVGAEVRTEITFADGHAGAPGIVHGGIVSAACDDFLGFALYLSPRTAVTRALQVDFHRAALVGTQYALRGWVEEAAAHKAWFACQGTDPQGRLTFTGRALFVNVPDRHFDQGQVTP